MRKVVGGALLVTGLLMCAAGIVLLGIWFLHRSQERPVARLALAAGVQETGPLHVDSPMCRLTVEMRVRTPSVWQGGGLIPSYEAQYKFPFSYRVVDMAGRTVHAETTPLMSVWSGGPRFPQHDTGTLGWQVFQEDLGSRGGTLRVEHAFGSFGTSSDRIVVEAEMGQDKRFKAEALDVVLTLYDNARGDAPLFVAIGLLLGGFVVLFAGLLLFARPRP